MQRVLQLVRARAGDLKKEEEDGSAAVLVPASTFSQWKIKVGPIHDIQESLSFRDTINAPKFSSFFVTLLLFSWVCVCVSFMSSFLQVDSHNNFPTAAGLASSASGLACFAVCVVCA